MEADPTRSSSARAKRSGSTFQLWSATVATPVAVPIDGSETVSSAVTGTATITVKKVQPPALA